jgi:alpha-amylase/alpha-mannosidase (GH57 family)
MTGKFAKSCAKVLACITLAFFAATAKADEKVPIYLAFILHMHQPIYSPGTPMSWDYFNAPTDPGSSTSVRQVYDDAGFCYRRPATIVNSHPNAKLTVHFTGSLIEQLDWLGKNGYSSKGTDIAGIWDDYRAAIKSGRLEMLVGGYYHPIYPLITQEDAHLQLSKMLAADQTYFGTQPTGFFPPEIAFDESIIPWLKDAGIKWSLFDSFHIVGLPNTSKWSKEYTQAAFRPHLAQSGDAKIIMVPREHWLGQNQSDGFDPNYLIGELAKIEQYNTDPAKPFLVVIASDGDNGWMRQSGGGYYDWFMTGLLDQLNQPQNSWIKMTTVSDYLNNVYTPSDTISVERGSWGVGGAHIDLSTWDSSDLHKQMWARVAQVRQQLQNAKASDAQMQAAWNYFAMGETSCYWYWNNTNWAQKSYAALNLALQAAGLQPMPSATLNFPVEEKVQSIAGDIGATLPQAIPPVPLNQ